MQQVLALSGDVSGVRRQSRRMGDGARTHRADSRRDRGPPRAARHRRRAALELPDLRQLRRRVRSARADRAHRQPRAPGAARPGGLSLGAVVRAAQRAAAARRAPRSARVRALHASARGSTGSPAASACSRGWGRSERSPSRAGRRPTGPCTRCSATCRRPRSRSAARVAVLVCCLSNLTVPEATEATIRVLLASGYDVEVPLLGCSGLPARTLGDRDAMVDMAIRNSAAMTESRGRRVHRRHRLVHGALPRVRKHRRRRSSGRRPRARRRASHRARE